MYPERERLPDLEQLKYEIIEWIPTRSNGMARLVKASTYFGEMVAIKIARVDEKTALTEKHNGAIRSEANCLRSLANSPGVVPILPIQGTGGNASPHSGTLHYCQTLEDEGAPVYLVQPFLAGGTLSRFVGTQPLMPVSSLRILYSLAHTLQWIHDKGWVHRDLKPSNIMFASVPVAEGKLEPIVIDLGIALPANTETEAEGTISWMAPEVRQSFDNGNPLRAAPSCDVYGLGLILCYMVSGQRPVAGCTSLENRQILIDSALSALQTSLPANSKAHKEINRLINALLHENSDRRPTAYELGNSVSRILAMLRQPISVSQRFAMHKKRYATTLWRLTGSLFVALFSIFLGSQLFKSPEQFPARPETVAAVEPTATALIVPPARFPLAYESPTATLLPSAQVMETPSAVDLSVKSTDGTSTLGGSGTPDDVVSSTTDADIEQTSVEELAARVASATPDEPSQGWMARFSVAPSFFSFFSRVDQTATPVAQEANSASDVTPTPTVTPTLTPGPFIFPVVADIVEVTGDAHGCSQNWQMTDTWNKAAPGARISITWKRIGPIPFDARARFQIGVAVDEQNLIPYRAIPVSEIVLGNSVEVDASNALWAIHGLVDRQRVVRTPYVWGVFLVGASGRMVTRVSPACFFQLDGELEKELPNG